MWRLSSQVIKKFKTRPVLMTSPLQWSLSLTTYRDAIVNIKILSKDNFLTTCHFEQPLTWVHKKNNVRVKCTSLQKKVEHLELLLPFLLWEPPIRNNSQRAESLLSAFLPSLFPCEQNPPRSLYNLLLL